MISEIRIGNVGPFGHLQVIPCRRLTLIYGPNNAGKSAILKTLLLARDLSRDGIGDGHHADSLGLLQGRMKRAFTRLDSPWVSEFGHFGLTVAVSEHEGEDSKKARSRYQHLGWHLATSTINPESGEYVYVAVLLVDHEPAVLFRGGFAQIYASDHPVFSGMRNDRRIPRGTVGEIRKAMVESVPEYFEHLPCETGSGELTLANYIPEPYNRSWPSPRLTKKFRAQDGNFFPEFSSERRFEEPGTVSGLVQKLGARASREATRALTQRLYALSPLRQVPEGRLLEGEETLGDEFSRGPLQEEFERWLAKFGFDLITTEYLPQTSRLIGHQGDLFTRVKFRDRRTGIVGGYSDFGDGLGQVAPILRALRSARDMSGRGDILFVRQPELHLHPRLQAELGDVFLEAALMKLEQPLERDEKRPGLRLLGRVDGDYRLVASPFSVRDRCQLFVETHSEQFLLRILRRVRETAENRLPDGVPPVRPSDIAVLYVNPQPHPLVESEVLEIRIGDDGRIETPWPDGFFGDRLEELR